MEFAILRHRGQGWFLSFHCFTKYVKVAFFRGASLRPLPPGKSKDRKCATSTSTRTTARRSAVHRLGEAGQPIARRTNVSGATTAMRRRQAEEERRERSKRRKLALPAIDARIKELGDWRGETLARSAPHQAGGPRSGRGVEVARGSRVGARRDHLHRRDLQGRREDDLCQGRLVGRPHRPLQLEPRGQHPARHRIPSRATRSMRRR